MIIKKLITKIMFRLSVEIHPNAEWSRGKGLILV